MKHPLFIAVIVSVVISGGVGVLVYSSQDGGTQGSAQNTRPVQASKVACLGRIEPKDGIVRIGARSLAGQPSLVAEMTVGEGDRVKAGQTLAVLDSRRQLEAAVRNLEAEVTVAQQRLAVVKAGARQGDIAAQKAEIARIEAALTNAQSEFNRYEELFKKDAATGSERDQKRTLVETTTQMLHAAKSRLASLEDVRDVDVSMAQAQLQSAMASVSRARTELDSTIVRAPFSGQVVKIHAQPGEEIGPAGLLELARTDAMYVIAEVFEADVHRVQIGQTATVTGDMLPTPLHGTVEHIGLKVAKNDVLNIDPVSLSDARVVEVKVRLDDSATASRLIYAQVTAVIGQ